jgi:Cft2 family RNA processing exonuclease
MRVEFTSKGIWLPDPDLWLDPAEGVGAAWLSHAHSDHARGAHGLAFGTPVTLEVYRMRWENVLRPENRLRPVEYRETLEHHGARLTAFPASHILGAAQALIELGGERLVYTGDLKLRPPLCGAHTEAPHCDRLIIESTFGLPIYRFLNREEASSRIAAFARECLAEDSIPAFLGYPLGRGQEVAHVLCEAGIPCAVHGSVARHIPVYEREGYSFKGWQPYDGRNTAGKALVVTPGFRKVLQASGKNIRIAYVSGWAGLDNARGRTGAEALIPYSDHGDFEELLAIVERSGARQVDVVHGYAEPFAQILQARGIEAHAPKALAARQGEEEATATGEVV